MVPERGPEIPPYNFEHHMEFAYTWEKTSMKPLFRFSDWNADPEDVEVPFRIIRRAIEDSLASLTCYAETVRLIETCEDMLRNLREAYSIPLPPGTGLHLFANVTQAIFAIMYALKEIVSEPRALLVHPSYYSVQDSARECRIPLVATWRRKAHGFGIDFVDLDRLREGHGTNIVIVTDPVYSVGISLTDSEWTRLVEYCRAGDMWLIVDMAFSGLSWIDRNRAWIDRTRLLRHGYRKVVLLDSPSKRLFTNNIKIGLVVTDEEMMECLRNFSDWLLGILTGLQLAFARQLFSPEYRDLLEKICRRNAARARTHFEQLEALVRRSPKISLVRPDSGFHAMLFATGSVSRDIDAMRASFKWITDLHALAVPTNDFFFDSADEFGFRLNLMAAPRKWEHLVRHVAAEGFPA